MKETLEKNKKGILIGVGALLVIVLVVVLWNRNNPKNTEQKKINVKVDIEDENGNKIVYDPNPLLERLNTGLRTRYYFDFSPRCDAIKELYNLDAPRFMATVRAYKVKYNESLKTHMDACWATCKTTGTYKGESYFELVDQRFNSLKDVIK